MYCYKHPKTETPLSCGRCEKPICTKCSVHADVGIRCRQCAPYRPRISGRGVPLLGGGVATIIGIVIVGSLLGGVLNGGSNSAGGPGEIGDFLDEQLQKYVGTVTASQLVDPWTPDATGDQPAPGRRYIALEVTVEAPTSDEVPGGFVSTSAFKLTDSEGFAYAPTASQAKPELPENLQLTPGEKTRGWIMFEIDAANEIDSLTYYTVDVALP